MIHLTVRWLVDHVSHPGEIMNAKLDWIEHGAIENLRLQHQCADTLAKESANTLTVLLAGTGAGTAYAAKAFAGQSADWLSVGAAAFTTYLLILCVGLVVNCLMIRPLPGIYNDPQNLLEVDLPLDELRTFQLEHVQSGIGIAATRNGQVAKSLNCIRLLAAISPFWFLVAFVVSWALS